MLASPSCSASTPEHLFRLSPSPPTFPPLPRAFSFLFRNFAANKKQNEYEQEDTLQTISASVGYAESSDICECTDYCRSIRDGGTHGNPFSHGWL
jgi:hypothetical protein